jgi:integrase/recombinase XerD
MEKVIEIIGDFYPATFTGYRSPKNTKENTLKERNHLMQTTQIMSQAKTLTSTELEQVLSYIATQSFPQRNRLMLLTGLWSGMRVGEISSLTISDVMNPDSSVKAEVRLTAEQTKGRQPRTVFLPQKLRDELSAYLVLRTDAKPEHPLFVTAGRKRFSANVMAQHFHYLFKRAGIAGASSHSMRRSFITNLATKGIGVRVLASLAGHRSIAVTQRYIDVNDEMKRNAVELI